MAKKTKADVNIVDGKYVTLTYSKKSVNFSVDMMKDEFLDYLTDSNIGTVNVHLDACEKPISIFESDFNELRDSRYSTSEYTANNLIKVEDIGVKKAYAIACMYAIKQLPVDDMVIDFAISHLLVGGVDNCDGIRELNNPYSVVVAKNRYHANKEGYFGEIVSKMSIKPNMVNIGNVCSGFESKVVETIDVNGEIYYTTDRNKKINEYTLSLINAKSGVILRSVSLDDVFGDVSQYDAINGIAKSDNRLFALSALPGAGKSATIVNLVEANPGNVCVVAHFNSATNNVSDRIKSGYSIPAVKVTKHGIEEYKVTKPMTITSTYNWAIKKAIDLSKIELLIVDESSVLSYAEIAMVYSILSKCGNGCKLLLVGDINQCYPVRSRGLPMLEILHSEAKVFFLRKSHRMHPTMAQVITDCNKGILKLKHDGEVINVFEGSDTKASNYAIKKYDSAENTASFGMIAFVGKECVSINSYIDNEFLDRLKLTRDKNGKCPNYVGRRVLSLDNVKKYEIAKKNIFTIKVINNQGMTLERVDGRLIQIPTDDLPEFAPAWCCTVHSYQGSEVDEMLVFLQPPERRENHVGARFRANRNNTIVAMSRAKKILTVIYRSQEIEGDAIQYPLVNHETYYSPKKKYECKSF